MSTNESDVIGEMKSAYMITEFETLAADAKLEGVDLPIDPVLHKLSPINILSGLRQMSIEFESKASIMPEAVSPIT